MTFKFQPSVSHMKQNEIKSRLCDSDDLTLAFYELIVIL